MKKPVSKTKVSKKRKRTPAKHVESSKVDISKNIQKLKSSSKRLRGIKLRAEKIKKIKPVSLSKYKERMEQLDITFKSDLTKVRRAAARINSQKTPTFNSLPEDKKQSVRALKKNARTFHGIKIAKAWFTGPVFVSPCADKFGYMSPTGVRNTSKLPFNTVTRSLLSQLGQSMADPSRASGQDSISLRAGYTYFGQFVDHDITLDVSSNLDTVTDANTINNMRSPALDLDSVYGRGPALDPFLYDFDTGSSATSVRMQLGINTNTGPGGPSSNGSPTGMTTFADWDLPRIPGSNTAAIGDPRNNENLIVSQFHHAMLRFHNKVVDLIESDPFFTGDIFAESKKTVTHHYQWAVVEDFLRTICGSTAVDDALSNVSAAVNSAFRMPVEFSVGAYRFGHSMVRNDYWVNFNFPNASLAQVFNFARNPLLPVFSNWVVDFNAFFETGITSPVNNFAKKIDSVIAIDLASLPGFSNAMAHLAIRNLMRGAALGLPSGQAMASHFGISPLSSANMVQGLPASEVSILNQSGGLLLNKTPLWYYCLREASISMSGEMLGPVGGRIVAETFIRILKRDPDSYLNVSGGFVPFLPGATSGDFTIADILNFAEVTQP